MKNKDKKKTILKFLKKEGRSSTSRIAAKIKSNQWMAEQYLEQLEYDGKITKEVETKGVYWDLK